MNNFIVEQHGRTWAGILTWQFPTQLAIVCLCVRGGFCSWVFGPATFGAFWNTPGQSILVWKKKKRKKPLARMNRIWRKQDPHSGENDRNLQMYVKETRRTQSPKFIKDLALVSYTRRVGEAVPQIQVRNHSKAQRGTAANDIPLSSISAIIEHRQDGKEPVNRLVGQHICKDLSLPFVCKVERLPFSSAWVARARNKPRILIVPPCPRVVQRHARVDHKHHPPWCSWNKRKAEELTMSQRQKNETTNDSKMSQFR